MQIRWHQPTTSYLANVNFSRLAVAGVLDVCVTGASGEHMFLDLLE